MCRTGGRRCPSSRTTASGGTRSKRNTTQPPGDAPPPGNPSPAHPGDTPGGVHYNIATGNARVGWQADDAVITGGLVIDGQTGDTPPSGYPGPGQPGDTRAPVRNIVAGNARVGRQTGGTPGGDTSPGTGEDTTGPAGFNIATGNARVGVQAHEVVITGGLFLGGPPPARRPSPATGATTLGARVQQGTRNTAGTGDVIAVQAQHINDHHAEDHDQ